MKELEPLIPKWSNFLLQDKDLSTYSIYRGEFSSVLWTFLYKNWKHVFSEKVSSRKKMFSQNFGILRFWHILVGNELNFHNLFTELENI